MDTKNYETFQSATIDDVYADPKKFGAPTFEEFKANPDKWRGKTDEIFDQIDAGSKKLMDLKRMEFVVEFDHGARSYKASSLEMAERILKDEGYKVSQCEYKPDLARSHDGRYYARVIIAPRADQKPGIIHAQTI